jgi:hypothetical protein
VIRDDRDWVWSDFRIADDEARDGVGSRWAELRRDQRQSEL